MEYLPDPGFLVLATVAVRIVGAVAEAVAMPFGRYRFANVLRVDDTGTVVPSAGAGEAS